MEADLSKGEELLRSMLVALLEDPEADVSDIGKEIIELYPEDDQAYFPLSFYYMIQNDDENLVQIHKTLLEITDNPAPIYNLLGYSYMDLGRMEEAEDAFDTYIELEPGIPNPYDSKGDYYMKAEDYEKAYEFYMKAYEIDTLWSYKKAMKAQKMLEEAEGLAQ
jgi:tetratricopeptide (TPR) repeat protein